MSESNFQARKDENFNDCATIASSVSSNNSFRQRLREKFVFSNSNSHEIGQKAMEMKIENLESELQSKNQILEEQKSGIHTAGMLFKELKSKLKEKDKELNEVRAQLCNEEDFSSIKSLLESQKDSIIQSCMEMFDSKEGEEIIIKVAMEKSNRKIESEIGIHKDEIALFNPVSGEITKCRPCEIVERKLSKCLDIKEKYIEILEAELRMKNNEIKEQRFKIDTFSAITIEVENLKAQLKEKLKISKTSQLCCEICKVIVSSQIDFDKHMAGKKHKNKMTL